jgi:hypothetical protein
MRFIFILGVVIVLAGCTSQNKPLPMVRADDPFVQLNPTHWTDTSNDLITPPGNGISSITPAPIQVKDGGV